MRKIIVFILIIALKSPFSFAQDQSPKNLKDSLLLHYSWEEIKSMSSRDRYSIIRAIRGQEPLPDLPPAEILDFFGIKIIKDIPKDSIESIIGGRVALIKKEKESYRQEIFPNSIVDATEAWDGHRFYKNYIDRSFAKEGYMHIVNEMKNEEVSVFSNLTSRVYYFNRDGALRLITREMGFNINNGREFGWADKLPYQYSYEETYIWNDSIIYEYRSKATQYGVETYPGYSTAIDLDTTKVNVESLKIYYYKNNSFGYQKKEGKFHKSEWKEKMRTLPFIDQGSSANGGVISFRNRVLEYKEYKSEKNNYLSPAPTSFLEPYVIEPE